MWESGLCSTCGRTGPENSGDRVVALTDEEDVYVAAALSIRSSSSWLVSSIKMSAMGQAC